MVVSNRRLAFAAGTIVPIGMIAAYFYHVLVAPGNQMAREVAQAKARLLAETDHQALWLPVGSSLDATRMDSWISLNRWRPRRKCPR